MRSGEHTSTKTARSRPERGHCTWMCRVRGHALALGAEQAAMQPPSGTGSVPLYGRPSWYHVLGCPPPPMMSLCTPLATEGQRGHTRFTEVI